MALNTVRKYPESGPLLREARQPVLSRVALRKPPAAARRSSEAGLDPGRWCTSGKLRSDYTGAFHRVQQCLPKLRPVARPDPVVRFETAPSHQMQMRLGPVSKAGHKHRMLAAFFATLGYSRVSWFCHRHACRNAAGLPLHPSLQHARYLPQPKLNGYRLRPIMLSIDAAATPIRPRRNDSHLP